MKHSSKISLATDAFLRPISQLARHKKTWSPLPLSGVLWRASLNLGTVRDVNRFLQHPSFIKVKRSEPRFGLKYLSHNYLALSFTVSERASSFLHHYRRLQELLPDRLLSDILNGQVILHDLSNSEATILLTLGLARQIDFDKEGELVIKLQVDGSDVFVLSFTLVPGVVVHSQMDEVILISRMQGLPGSFSRIKLVTKALRDVAPAYLLLSVLQGVAVAFGVQEISSVNAENQTCYSVQYEGLFRSAYDQILDGMGIERNVSGFYSTPVPIPEKPLSFLKKGHKIRTRKKREFKSEIVSICSSLLTERMRNSC